MDNPTPNGWYITVKSDRYFGDMYYLHSTMDPTKSVFEKIPKLNGDSIVGLWLHTFKGIDLPPLRSVSHGYVLSIEQSDPTKLVWKKEGSRLIPYIYGQKEPDE
jgi:hypothetical protein